MNKRILIVEDETDLREAMAEALDEAGFTIFTAADGVAGLALAKTEQPNLILLDLMMPIMGGQEMLGHLREDPWGRYANVVILSAMDDVSHIANAHEGKILDYIIKGHTSLDELVKEVRLLVLTAK